MEQKWNNSRAYKKIKPTNQENPTKEKGSIIQKSDKRSLKLRHKDNESNKRIKHHKDHSSFRPYYSCFTAWILGSVFNITRITLQSSTSRGSLSSLQQYSHRDSSCNFTHIKLYAMYELYYILPKAWVVFSLKYGHFCRKLLIP